MKAISFVEAKDIIGGALSISKKHRPSSVVGIRLLLPFRVRAQAITQAARC